MKIPSHHPRIIKMTLLFACLGLCARADGYAQNIKVDLQVESRSLGEAFELLKRQTSLVFFFSNREV
ncbi:MAG: hypothetical protein LBG30_05740, partial [Odoribacteraceae bacterium]|nr:hypothetical protein [Odoribacteraceae bacterium]